MSKIYRPIPYVFSAAILILQFFTIADAQTVEATVKIDANSPSTVTVTGRFTGDGKRKNLSFILDYAGIAGLGARISDVMLTDTSGRAVPNRKMIAGEYLGESEIAGWSFKADIAPVATPSAAAHLSWLGSDGGIVMLDDILPQTGGKSSAFITFDLPAGWKIGTVEQPVSDGSVFQVADTEKAVFFIDRDGRRRLVSSGKTRLRLAVSGEWQFSDEDAAAMASAIFADYERLFGSSPSGDFFVSINKFPHPVEVGNWEADTRGRTVTLMSSDMPFKSQSLQRLHEQLRHELFHLWIPNGVNLSGNYDWFYEGFALYQSLKTGVSVNRIRFDDMLDTLSRAYDIDRFQIRKPSLIEASKNRWNGANTQVYARGMLVAFLCDLALLENSKGKRSVTDLLRDLYLKHHERTAAMDGSEAVIELMGRRPELSAIIERNIKGVETIDWTALINAVGIAAETKDQGIKLIVTAKPSGSQKNILDKLGYNNWRQMKIHQ